MPDGLEANGAPRPRGRVFMREAVGEEPRVCQRRRVGHLAHPPVVKVREDRSHPQPSIRQVLQCG
jgi:hypothetical protein